MFTDTQFLLNRSLTTQCLPPWHPMYHLVPEIPVHT
jgi:hypothetical protein